MLPQILQNKLSRLSRMPPKQGKKSNTKKANLKKSNRKTKRRVLDYSEESSSSDTDTEQIIVSGEEMLLAAAARISQPGDCLLMHRRAAEIEATSTKQKTTVSPRALRALSKNPSDARKSSTENAVSVTVPCAEPSSSKDLRPQQDNNETAVESVNSSTPVHVSRQVI